jgi:hypothetical protein
MQSAFGRNSPRRLTPSWALQADRPLGTRKAVANWRGQDQVSFYEEIPNETKTDPNRLCRLFCADPRSLRGKRI